VLFFTESKIEEIIQSATRQVSQKAPSFLLPSLETAFPRKNKNCLGIAMVGIMDKFQQYFAQKPLAC